MKTHPQSPEWQKADAQLKDIDERMKKRAPGDRHEKRMAALYVEPLSKTEWNIPAKATPLGAFEFLQAAMNDYSGPYNNGYVRAGDSILKHTDPTLHAALEAWAERPELPPLEALKYPD